MSHPSQFFFKSVKLILELLMNFLIITLFLYLIIFTSCKCDVVGTIVNKTVFHLLLLICTTSLASVGNNAELCDCVYVR